MKKLTAVLIAATSVLAAPFASAQKAPSGFEGVWQTKEWFGTIANMRFVECEPDGPYCIQVVSLEKGDGFEPGDLFMVSLDVQGKDLRRGAMRIPGGPSLPGGVFWLNENQVELRALGAQEIWEKISN